MWKVVNFPLKYRIKRIDKTSVIQTLIVKLVIVNVLYLSAMPAYSGDNKPTLSEIIKIGKPSQAQFPLNNVADCYARSVWDMHYYNGRIYIGSGDYSNDPPGGNRGPINIWSFQDDSGKFTDEIRVSEEQVSRFCDYSGRLYIPGDDPRGHNTGTIYINDNGIWEELRTIPNANHITDVAVFKDKLYACITSKGGQVLESDDGGKTWKLLAQIGCVAIIPFNDYMLIFTDANTGRSSVWKYDGSELKELGIPLFYSTRPEAVYRAVLFRNGVIYTTSSAFFETKMPRPLFFLEDLENGSVMVEEFREKHVRDIIVRSDTCYILTAMKLPDDEFSGYIYSSQDVKNWTKVAEFSVPALPYSFELMDGYFYVGLGNRSKYNGYADAESGGIYKLKIPPQDEDHNGLKGDVNGDEKVGSDDAILVLQNAAGLIKFTEYQRQLADMNNDGKIGADDAILILRKVVGLEIFCAAMRAVDEKQRHGLFPDQPRHSALLQNFPNPFNPETWIPYQLRENSEVTIRIHSVNGKIVKELILGYRKSGYYITSDKAVHWDGTDSSGERVADGIYFYTIYAGNFIATRKMVILS
jgi:hypothetical protein